MTHIRVITVIPLKTILGYGDIDASNLFSVQVCCLLHLFAIFSPSLQISAFCNDISASVSPWVQLSTANVTAPTMCNIMTSVQLPIIHIPTGTLKACWNNRVSYMGSLLKNCPQSLLFLMYICR
jgi:chitin synthase